MSVTLEDIAQRAGVSTAAVSMVLRGKGRVSEPKRLLIRQTADALGYRPNLHAVSMKRGDSGFVGLLVSEKAGSSHLFDPLLQGILDETQGQNRQLMISRVQDSVLGDDKKLREFVRRWQADCMLIYYTHNFPEALRELLVKYRIPAVWVNADLPENSVCVDEALAARAMTEHLVRQGCSNIVFVDLQQKRSALPHYSRLERCRGYQEGLTKQDPLVLAGSGSAASHLETCLRYFKAHDGIDALIGRSPKDITTAVCAMERLKPGSIGCSVQAVGFSTEPLLETGRLITTIQVPMRQMSTVAVKMALDLRENDSPQTSVRLPCTYIQGFSTNDIPHGRDS